MSSPVMGDPNFDHSVIFMLEHDSAGALGVVMTQSTGSKVIEVLPQLSQVASTEDLIFVGGPVDHQSAIAVAAAAPGTPIVNEVIPGIGTTEIPSDDDSAHNFDGIDAIRIYVGYSGWGAGQLDAELSAGGWFTVEGNATDPVRCDPETLWEQIIRSQGGETAWLANFPEEPRLN